MRNSICSLLLPLLLPLLLSLGCGQSGTEGTGTPPSNCVCDQDQHNWAVAGTVLSSNPLRLEVTTIFPQLPSDLLAVGDVVGGSWSAELPCNKAGGLAASELPAVGEQALVFLKRGDLDQYPSCQEYQSCTAACGAAPGPDADPTSPEVGAWDVCDGGCVETTAAACSSHRSEALLASSLRVLPWSAPHYLGEVEETSIEVQTADLALIAQDPGTCYEAFEQATIDSMPEPL